MKSKLPIISFLGVVLLAGANYFLFQYSLEKSLDLVDVYIANQTIEPRTQIDESMITTVSIPSAYLDTNCALSMDEIVGKYTDIQGKIPNGSMFYKSMLYEAEELPDYPALCLKENQAVFSMNTDLVQTAGNSLMPGQLVDIYCSIEIRNENPIIDLLISNVRILTIKDHNGIDVQSEFSTAIPYVITLALQKNQIPLLSSANSVGTLQLYASSSAYTNSKESILNSKSSILEYLNNESN